MRDEASLQRIRSLAIPPAWTEVWICPSPHGHLQATGRDAKGRKQFRYHARWTALRDADKFSRVVGFSRVLPRIRRRVARDLRRPGLSHEKVVATVVWLLETTLIRVGNDEYARDNRSYGLTTLRGRHATVRGSTVRLRFRGKSGKEVEAVATDRRVARIVKQLQELPGQELFSYFDESGAVRDITSEDVNAYLRETTGGDYTAKDFRTWAGTVMAAAALRHVTGFESLAEAQRNVVQAIDSVARRLGNTRAVARRSYVHPHIVQSYLDGKVLDEGSIERAVLSMLKKQKA